MSTARVANWDEMIAGVDLALARIKEKFLVAFAEGQPEPDGRELIKRGLFETIWKKLAVSPTTFYELSDVDEYYHKLLRELLSHISAYSRQDDIRALVSASRLVDPITETKIDMLRKISVLYHAFARNRFILKKLREIYSAEKCEEEVFAIEQEAKVNESLLLNINVDSYMQRILQPLVCLNEGIISVIHQKGYGVSGPANSSRMRYSEDGERLFSGVFRQLEALPSNQELYDLMMSKGVSNGAERNQQLMQHAGSLGTARELLIVLRDDLLRASEKCFTEISDQYDSLSLIRDKLNGEENAEINARGKVSRKSQFDELFRLLRELKNAQNSLEQANEHNYPVLYEAALETVKACSKQSPTDNLFPFARIGWNAARDTIQSEVDSFIKATRVIDSMFAHYHERYDAAIARVNKKSSLYQDIAKLISGWNLVNERLRHSIDVVCEVLGKAEAHVTRSQQTNWQYLREFLKRNRWFIIGGATVLGGAGAAIAFTVMTPVAASALIPGGALAGGAGGAGIGVIKDNAKPPVVTDDPSPLILNAAHHPYNTGAIMRELFGEGRQVSNEVTVDVPQKSEESFASTLTGLDAMNGDLTWPDEQSYPSRVVGIVPEIWKALPLPDRDALPSLPIPSLPAFGRPN